MTTNTADLHQRCNKIETVRPSGESGMVSGDPPLVGANPLLSEGIITSLGTGGGLAAAQLVKDLRRFFTLGGANPPGLKDSRFGQGPIIASPIHVEAEMILTLTSTDKPGTHPTSSTVQIRSSESDGVISSHQGGDKPSEHFWAKMVSQTHDVQVPIKRRLILITVKICSRVGDEIFTSIFV